MATDEENAGNLKRQLANLFETSLRITVPDEKDIEPMVTACAENFADYQCDNAMTTWTQIKGKGTQYRGPPAVGQLRKMLDLLVHASQCRSAICQYPNCRKVKGLFRHGITCKTRASGGCGICKKMWYLLQLHARACKESECHVPRCRDLRIPMRRLQQQADSRRRAAVMEMMRQRAA